MISFKLLKLVHKKQNYDTFYILTSESLCDAQVSELIFYKIQKISK